MKLKYKRCLKTAQAQYTERIHTCRHPECSTETTFGLSGCALLCAVWARRVDPGCWCLLLTVSSTFTNHHHPPATLLTSETTKQNQKSFRLDLELAELEMLKEPEETFIMCEQ